MKIRIFAASALLLSLSCARTPPLYAEEPAALPPEPQVGVIGAMHEQAIALQLPGKAQPELYDRAIQTQVICHGEEVGWEALEAGQVVRVRWTQGVFGPPFLIAIEILDGIEADAIREQVQGPSGGGPCPGGEGEEATPEQPGEAPAPSGAPPPP